MKNIYSVFTIFIISVLFLSCNKDDDNVSINQENLIGKWKITNYQDSEISNLEELIQYEPCGGQDVFDFSTNGILYFSYAYGDDCSRTGTNNLKYDLSGNVLTTIEEDGGYNPNTDYVIKYQVITITDSTLILKAVYVDDGFGDNPDLSNEEMFTVSFKRI